MSYTYEVKNEIIKKSNYTTKEKVAELRGILEVKNAILEDRIELKLESIELANRVYRLLKEVTTLKIRVKYLVGMHFGEHKVYVLVVERQNGFKDLLRILATCSEESLLKDEEKRVGFIRGLFLMSGYIKSPEKEYALDFFIDNIAVGEELFRIFVSLHKKVFITDKRKKKLVYFRNSEDILDVIVMLGAMKEFYKYEETTMLKDLKNKTIREMNWEVANETKSLNTGLKQTRMINYIGKKIGLNELTPVLEEVAFLRLQNPESSLQELAEMIGISKSGIRNRFRRIEAIYKEILIENEKE